jgi:O-antigen/teichoic acid export membrane protein
MTAEPETAFEGPASRFGAQRLYRDAASLASSSITNAFLGVAFWAAAAKMFPPAQLGVMTAVLAVIVSVAIVVATGVGDAYTALLPAAGVDRPHLYRRGQRVFVVLALASGVAAAGATVTWLDEVRGSVAVAALVIVGVFAWGALTLQTSTLVALGRARWLPATTIAANVTKIALLVLLAYTASWHPVELSFVVSAVVVITVLQPMIDRVVRSAEDLPPATAAEGVLNRTFTSFVGQTVTSSALTMGLLMVTPFLVTVYSDPKQGALFALSLAIAQALDFIGGSLAMSLVVHASSAPEEAGAMARKIMIRAIALSSAGALVLIAVVPTALRLLNPEYGALGATGVIAALAAGSVVRCIYMVWVGLQKARRNMTSPLVLNAITGVVLMAAMAVLVPERGAWGGAIALLFAQVVLVAGIIIHYGVTRRRAT